MRAELTVRNVAQRVEGPLLFLKRTVTVGLNDAVQVIGQDGVVRLGRVATLDEDSIIVEVLESTAGLGVRDTVVSMLGEPVSFDLGPNLLGRVFDSVGRPLDGQAPIPAMRRIRIDGMTINPARRALPRDFIETGITAIDLMNCLVRGQKLPLFSGSGLPHDRLATEIAQRARLRDDPAGDFAVVFVGIGISHDVAEAFRSAMETSGALGHTVMFLNRADESSAQRLLTPRYALTAAEYLAFEEGRHVLVIMTDMTNYCEALREVSASHGEIPGRKGFPGYMYSDLATLFERAGCLHGKPGTLTQLPILTLPGDDIGHPIPDLTGYITEGQIVLDRDLDRRRIYPPINVLPSLSRLMAYGTGEGFTHADHPALASQLFAAYANSRRVRVLASVMGQEGLSDIDRNYLDFGDRFEEQLISQPGARTLNESMAIAWEILAVLPDSELTRLSNEQIETCVRRKSSHA
ncbi:MAG: V-type ATP synthase subunit B [Gammaproteobacteria bacterium]|nr:V-type ATP synthase subunit B [Gammaproteobacteria bacterium]MDH5213570.1 V-type ATP synthase subunit B [Gammaproteobacteria bacterium]MDH5499792.1 V-type ATP synthase subunit B [Gammaproteobacteria bacterium]